MRRLLFLLLTAAAVQARAAEVAVVLGSDLPPYQETLAGIKAVLGEVPVVDVSRGSPAVPHTRLVIAIGTRAALLRYSDETVVIYCIAPGLPAGYARQPHAKVDMAPAPDELVRNIRKLAPTARRLGVIWSSSWFSGYIDALERAGAHAGLEIVTERVANPEGVPDALRSLKGRADALWTPMDPRALSAVSLATITPFSESSGIPYFAPARTLIRSAAAAIGPSFTDVGRAAGNAARSILKGAAIKPYYFPENVIVTVNAEEAARLGLRQ